MSTPQLAEAEKKPKTEGGPRFPRHSFTPKKPLLTAPTQGLEHIMFDNTATAKATSTSSSSLRRRTHHLLGSARSSSFLRRRPHHLLCAAVLIIFFAPPCSSSSLRCRAHHLMCAAALNKANLLNKTSVSKTTSLPCD